MRLTFNACIAKSIFFFYAFRVLHGISVNDDIRLDGENRTFCFQSNKISWINNGKGGVLLRDDKGGLHRVRMKGVSWHGFDTVNYSLDGLNKISMESVIISLKKHDFNAIRVPISLDFALWRRVRVAAYTDLCDEVELASMQLHRLFLRAAAHGILVMVDLHTLYALPTSDLSQSWKQSETTYDMLDLLDGWNGMLFDFLEHPNFFALDAFDGPHIGAGWKGGKVEYEDMLLQLVNLLEVGHQAGSMTRWFRGLLGMKPYRNRSFNVADSIEDEKWQRRIIYTPQVESLMKRGFTKMELNNGFPENLFAETYGYLEMEHGHTVVIADWVRSKNSTNGSFVGYQLSPKEETQYLNIFSEWLRVNGLNDVFFNLGTTTSRTGIFKSDWKSFSSCHLDFLKRINPSPTIIAHINTDVICVADWGTGIKEKMNYNGLDCLDQNNDSRCISCDSQENIHNQDLLLTTGYSLNNCVPWNIYEELNALDENSALKDLGFRISNLVSSGFSSTFNRSSNPTEYEKISREAHQTVENLKESRFAIVEEYIEITSQLADSIAHRSDRLKKKASKRKPNVSYEAQNMMRSDL